MYDIVGMQLQAGMGIVLGVDGSDFDHASDAMAPGAWRSAPASTLGWDAGRRIPFSSAQAADRAEESSVRRRARRHRIREVVPDPAYAYSPQALVSRRSPT